MSSYATTEAKRFLYEVGRANAILQTDDETTIKAVAEGVDNKISGRSVRAAPTGSKGSQGFIDQYHNTLHDKVRT